MRCCRTAHAATAAAPVATRIRAPMFFPSVKKLLHEKHLERSSVQPSGRLGQLLKGDVLAVPLPARVVKPAAGPSAAQQQPRQEQIVPPTVVTTAAAAPPPPAAGVGKSVPHSYAFMDVTVGSLLAEAVSKIGLLACVLQCLARSLPSVGLVASGTPLLVETFSAKGSSQRFLKSSLSGAAMASILAQPASAGLGGPASFVVQDYSGTALSCVTSPLPAGAVGLLSIGSLVSRPSLSAGSLPVAVPTVTLSLSYDVSRVSEDQAQLFLSNVVRGLTLFGI